MTPPWRDGAGLLCLDGLTLIHSAVWVAQCFTIPIPLCPAGLTVKRPAVPMFGRWAGLTLERADALLAGRPGVRMI